MDFSQPRIPPSIAQLFRTNSVPSITDEHRIHLLAGDAKAQLALVSDAIDRARAEVLRLEHRRDHVVDVIQELEALMSPVRRMPTDIMTNVFEHCVHDRDVPMARLQGAPVVLAQVCRSWRYLIFSLPCLWSTLSLDLPSGSKNWEALIQSKSLAMHVWFSRSKALPISLTLDHAKGSLMPWHALMLLDKEILTLGCRLKDLSLRFSPRSLSCLLTFTQSPLPYLQHLELQNANSLPTSENPPPIVFHSAPKLKSLSLSWCSLDLRGFQIPWSQLQHLNFQYDASPFWNPIHTDYLQTLALCPNLTTLCLGIGAPIGNIDPDHIKLVTLPRLHTFHTNIYLQTLYLAHFFNALQAPILRHFSIKNVSLALGSFDGQTECLPFLTRCADSLETVYFKRLDISDPDILSCLAQLHRLRSLTLFPGVIRLNHGLITALTLFPDGIGESGIDETGAGTRTPICPDLETLELRCSSVVPADAIIRLVASRCRTAKLKKFSLHFATFEYGLDTRDDKMEQVRAQLTAQVEDGLQLQLSKADSG